ncbi:hypothetical protein [Taibaiella soli]|uniref:Glycosyltransferase RgtA/B/C/D-like domain-containing protein n=1 Tax=Taibaiella soli TaxID=1649169 RepID=A0A2W2B717_9BACT|nr:hypothetical protein [Taibaiella soli]PZF72029.1 hypothetical protein DN068_15450 [Taibaiella soli]
MQFITLTDYLLLPFYVVIIYMIAYRFRNNKYPEGHPWRPYFMPALTAKIVGAIFIGLIYQYYYGGGDTANYYLQGGIINSSMAEGPSKWFNLLFSIPEWYEPGYWNYISQLYWYNSVAEYTVCGITAVCRLLTFGTYLPIALIFASLAFTGFWALFRTFVSIYPKYIRAIAVAVLFIPSCIMWGSGLFKDTLCMFGLGWMTFAAFRLLINRDFSFKNILIAIASFYLVAHIKIYIQIAFLPAVVLWILFSYSHKILNGFVRFFVRIAVIGICAGGFMLMADKFSEDLGKYSLDKIGKTAEITATYLQGISVESGGSVYDLGTFDPSLQGMLTKFFPAVNATFFRPYVWEAGKALQFLSAIEALLFLFITLKVLLVVGPLRVWRTIVSDPNIQFCLIFSTIFAFAVGVSSYNFGTLSRYKIPCLPFYILAMVLIFYKNAEPGKRLLGRLI